MRWILVLFLVVTLTSPIYTKDVVSNELSIPPSIKLDTTLRKALLRALTELENEENQKAANEESLVEKASASSFSFYANSDNETTTATTTTTTTGKPTVLFQKSEESTEKSYTSFENDTDPSREVEQFLTSASSSFPTDSDTNEARSLSTSSKNSLAANDKPSTIETTTVSTTTTSTEESEAKVEQVQFFSAPLVAAFTVHQDEQGQAKKVEPIFKPIVSDKQKEEFGRKEEEKKLKFQQEQEQIKQRFQQNQEEIKQRHQLELAVKQKSLEEEIVRLRRRQREQEAFFKQQLLQQEQARLRNSAQFNQFHAPKPVLDEPTKKILNQFVTERNVVNSQNGFSNFVTPTPPNTFNNNGVSFQPSISFDPLVEAGRLPLNGQILPVKNAVDFYSPFIQTPNFQQFHSVSNTFNPPFVNSFPQQFNSSPQPNRFFRQEQGVGNFGTNIQQRPVQRENSFNNKVFTNNNLDLPPTLQQNFQNLNSLQNNNNKPLRNNLDLPPSIQNSFKNAQQQQQQQQQQTRTFRSNLEGALSSPDSLQNFRPPAPNNQLNNLLFNSGALRGKPQEDLSLISKVLSLNHLGSDSRFRYRNVPFRK